MIWLMYLSYIFGLFQAKQVTEEALNVTPYNTIAYGLLVALLIGAVVFMWREYRRVQGRYRDHVEKTVGLVQVVESKLDSIDEMKDESYDIRNKVDNLEAKVGKLSEHINLLRGNESN